MKVSGEVAKAMGNRLQQIRQTKGLTQVGLAEAAGVPIGTLRNWEQGVVLPQLTAAWKLARALSISLDELVGDVLEEKPAPKPAKGKKSKAKE